MLALWECYRVSQNLWNLVAQKTVGSFVAQKPSKIVGSWVGPRVKTHGSRSHTFVRVRSEGKKFSRGYPAQIANPPDLGRTLLCTNLRMDHWKTMNIWRKSFFRRILVAQKCVSEFWWILVSSHLLWPKNRRIFGHLKNCRIFDGWSDGLKNDAMGEI